MNTYKVDITARRVRCNPDVTGCCLWFTVCGRGQLSVENNLQEDPSLKATAPNSRVGYSINCLKDMAYHIHVFYALKSMLKHWYITAVLDGDIFVGKNSVPKKITFKHNSWPTLSSPSRWRIFATRGEGGYDTCQQESVVTRQCALLTIQILISRILVIKEQICWLHVVIWINHDFAYIIGVVLSRSRDHPAAI